MKLGIVKVNGKRVLVFPWKGYLVDVLEFAKSQKFNLPANDPEELIKLEKTVPNLLRLWNILEVTENPPGYNEEEVQWLPPILYPEKIICLGLNYYDHCEENKVPPPKNPILFAKYRNALTGHKSHILLPESSKQVDYEAELVVVIGRGGKRISEEKAMDYVLGYTIGNDVSARDCQFPDKQWVRGKTFDTFLPLGPYIVTPDEVGDVHNLRIRLELNGQTMQDSSTSKMIFSIPQIISFISRDITLAAGDIICTGTPLGVGYFREPQIFLKEGDKIKIEIEKIGTLENSCVKS